MLHDRLCILYKFQRKHGLPTRSFAGRSVVGFLGVDVGGGCL